MPKIAAPTVREHREHIEAALVDAAEHILREHGTDGLTAAAVSQQAGIARNSIYRYVTSVDDLRGLVVAKYLPQWNLAVDQALDGVADPRDRIAVWTRANLLQASRSGHGWLMSVARGVQLPPQATDAFEAVHSSNAILRDAVRQLAPADPDLLVELIRSLVDAGFRRLDAGDAPEPLVESVTAAVLATVDALT